MGNQAIAPFEETSLGRVRESLDLLETDLAKLIASMGDAAQRVHTGIGLSSGSLEKIRRQSEDLSTVARSANDDARQLAIATQELAASSDEIGRQIHAAGELTAKATAAGTEAGDSIQRLNTSSTEIGTIIGLIVKIAKQTQLLALNATIEAARAGDAGRGFAVVASEIKTLSIETQKAADDIRRRVGQLQNDAHASGDALTRISSVIHEVQPLYSGIAAAVQQQIGTAQAISENAATTSNFIDGVSTGAGEIREATEAATRESHEVDQSGRAAAELANKLRRNLSIFLRQTEIGDRRQSDRLPCELAVSMEGTAASKTVDIGSGGVLVQRQANGQMNPDIGRRVMIDIAEIGRVRAETVNRSDLGIHLKFVEMDAPTQAALEKKILAIMDENRDYIERAKKAGSEISHCFEQLIESRRITPAILFDNDYVPIAGTDPQQYRTHYLDIFDEMLPPIQERLLSSDQRMVFAIAIDRNGYIPVHNAKYSQPQRPGDLAWNVPNSRNRRIFDDRAGLCAARSVRPYLIQSYPRDMGNGVMVLMKEIDVPIRVLGRHWGGFRMAYKM
jgi:methyl-accepting chemotaxis protein